MDARDLIVEVRDANLVRVGRIQPRDLRLQVAPLCNDVGSWTVELPLEHPMAEHLREPGSGIVVTGPDDVLISGPTTSSESYISTESRAGTTAFSGVCDNIYLWDRLAYPDPTTDDTMDQGEDFDIRAGGPRAVIAGYVQANAGPTAPPSRRVPHLSMEAIGTEDPDQTVTKSARFDNLGDFIKSTAEESGVRFRIVQRGDVLSFETAMIADRTKTVRLDVRNGTLAGHRVAIKAPEATKAIVGTRGEPTEEDITGVQLWATVTTDAANTAEATWGRRIETFVDQSYQPDEEAWTQSALESLAESLRNTVAAQATPLDDTTMRFGRDWDIGDRVTIVAFGQEITSVVTGFVVQANDEGLKVGVALGDGAGFNAQRKIQRRVQALETRIFAMERALR